jgi:hypothetical protein
VFCCGYSRTFALFPSWVALRDRRRVVTAKALLPLSPRVWRREVGGRVVTAKALLPSAPRTVGLRGGLLLWL